MKGLAVEKAGAPFTVHDNIGKPTPAADQILVKSIVTAVNPVDVLMQSYGIMVSTWPIVLGCDAGGVVVEVGQAAASTFKVGDEVCGCTRLGIPGYGTFQEYFLMDASLAMPKPKILSLEQASTTGVGTYTACLGVFGALNTPLLKDVNQVQYGSAGEEDWAVVFGGASSVGQYAVQLLKLSGFKVLASCSPATAPLVKNLGADETLDYKESEEAQVEKIAKITGKQLSRVFDATGKSHDVGVKALETASKSKGYFTTTAPGELSSGSKVSQKGIMLGPIGQSGPALAGWPTLNEDIASYVPMLVRLFDAGALRPNEVDVVAGAGFESLAQTIKDGKVGCAGGTKVVVRLQSV